MKTWSIFLLLASISFSCSDSPNNSYYKFGVDIQSNFNDDNVRVVIDGHEHANKKFTTNNLLGVCYDGILTTTLSAGKHTLQITVNNITKTQTFNLSGNLYSGVNYDNTAKQISILFSGFPFGYD